MYPVSSEHEINAAYAKYRTDPVLSTEIRCLMAIVGCFFVRPDTVVSRDRKWKQVILIGLLYSRFRDRRNGIARLHSVH